jgi:hypothetical protein
MCTFERIEKRLINDVNQATTLTSQVFTGISFHQKNHPKQSSERNKNQDNKQKQEQRD